MSEIGHVLRTDTVRRIYRFMPSNGTSGEACMVHGCRSDALKAPVYDEGDDLDFLGYVCSKHSGPSTLEYYEETTLSDGEGHD